MALPSVLLFTHVLRLVSRIIFSQYAYSRRALLSTYFSLLRESYRFNRITPGSAPPYNTTSVFGYNFRFRHYGQFIDMFEEIFILRAYEPTYRRKAGLFFDCGANIGLATLYFKLTDPECRVVAFEPHLETFKLLELNVTANQLSNVTLHNVALGACNQTATLYGNERYTLNMSLDENYGPERNTIRQPVQVRQLSDWINETVNLVKVDVEGGEHAIIDDLVISGKIAFLENLIVEYHYEKGQDEFSSQVRTWGFHLKVEKRSEHVKEALLCFWRAVPVQNQS